MSKPSDNASKAALRKVARDTAYRWVDFVIDPRVDRRRRQESLTKLVDYLHGEIERTEPIYLWINKVLDSGLQKNERVLALAQLISFLSERIED